MVVDQPACDYDASNVRSGGIVLGFTGGTMDFAVWESAFASAVREMMQRVVAYLPNVAAALGLVLLGWAVAWLARAVVSKGLAAGLGLLLRQRSFGRAVERTRLGPGFVKALSAVVYWFILALFVAAAVERLELTIAASLVSAFAALLPRVLIALLIVFAGVIAGQVVYAAVQRTASAAGIAQAALLARAAQMLLIFFGIVTAADQLGIQSTLLTVVVATAVGAVLGGATLAFGLGSGAEVGNIVAIFYVLKNYRVGQVVRIGGIEGKIVGITQTGVFIASPEGRVLVPGRRFTEEPSTLITGGQS
jgi:small-conductance mechanosensitive channel